MPSASAPWSRLGPEFVEGGAQWIQRTTSLPREREAARSSSRRACVVGRERAGIHPKADDHDGAPRSATPIVATAKEKVTRIGSGSRISPRSSAMMKQVSAAIAGRL
jgi:hypothetical protein